MQIYKILSVLLEYPDRELIEHLPEVRVAIGNSRDADAAEKETLRKLVAHLANTPLTELQASYVQTFDLTPEHSLHLTHHLFGDDNDKNRGPALIDLGELYKDYGVKQTTNELPDFLPLILEFVAGLERDEASVFLSDAGKVLGVLAANLAKADSPYAPLLALVERRASLTCLM